MEPRRRTAPPSPKPSTETAKRSVRPAVGDADAVMAHAVTACVGVAYAVMADVGGGFMAAHMIGGKLAGGWPDGPPPTDFVRYVVMAYIIMAYRVIAYVVIAYKVMAMEGAASRSPMHYDQRLL